MIELLRKPDAIGSFTSTLCLIHCIATPFIFISQSLCTKICCAGAPIWWQSLDYIFVIISFFAIYRSTKTSTNKAIKILLWIVWVVFFTSIIAKSANFSNLFLNTTYASGITLALLHIYNLKFCQCCDDDCCIDK